jgi:hypothetical protein
LDVVTLVWTIPQFKVPVPNLVYHTATMVGKYAMFVAFGKLQIFF